MRARVVHTRVVAVGSIVLAAVLLFRGLLPDWFGVRFLVESVLPLLGVLVLALAVAALALRIPRALVFVLVPAMVWVAVFGPRLVPLAPSSTSAESGRLVIASQNVQAGNPRLDETVDALVARAPDVIALQEYTGGLDAAVAGRVDAGWPHHIHVGTVALFSRYSVVDGRRLALGLGWVRAFSAVIQAPGGDVTVYVVHADSARVTDHSDRDRMLRALAQTVRDDHAARVVVVGDFNAGSDDSALAPLQAELQEPAQSTGGLGFTWPSPFPFVRLDHLFERGVHVTSLTVLPATGSDHRGILADLHWTPGAANRR